MVLTVFRPKFAWFSVIWRVGCVKAKTSLKRNEAWVLVVLVSSLVMLMILVLMVFWVGKARCAQGRGRQGWALVTYSGGTRHSIRKLLAPSRNQWWWIRSTRCPASTPPLAIDHPVSRLLGSKYPSEKFGFSFHPMPHDSILPGEVKTRQELVTGRTEEGRKLVLFGNREKNTET